MCFKIKDKISLKIRLSGLGVYLIDLSGLFLLLRVQIFKALNVFYGKE